MDNSLYAAVDLGSNSFHMVIARLTEGRMQIIDRIKERVRLAEGSHTKYAVNNGQLSSMNVLQVVC